MSGVSDKNGSHCEANKCHVTVKEGVDSLDSIDLTVK